MMGGRRGLLTLVGVRLTVIASLSLLSGSVASAEIKWRAGPYKYVVIDQDIKDVMIEFGSNINVPVRVSDQVTGHLRGPLPITTAEDFLKGLCESHGLVWYFDGSVLHISAAKEIETVFIDIGRLRPQELSDKLLKLGIADSRYPVIATANADVVSVSGPPPYVSLVQRTAAAMVRAATPRQAPGDEPRVRVFRGG
jgi:type II secretory pathway component GspD/PulD (secretin)